MKTFVTTEKQAIAEGKRMLKNTFDIKSIKVTTKGTSTQCACGETYAVNIYAKIRGQYQSETIGVCEYCANNN